MDRERFKEQFGVSEDEMELFEAIYRRESVFKAVMALEALVIIVLAAIHFM